MSFKSPMRVLNVLKVREVCRPGAVSLIEMHKYMYIFQEGKRESE